MLGGIPIEIERTSAPARARVGDLIHPVILADARLQSAAIHSLILPFEANIPSNRRLTTRTLEGHFGDAEFVVLTLSLAPLIVLVAGLYEDSELERVEIILAEFRNREISRPIGRSLGFVPIDENDFPSR